MNQGEDVQDAYIDALDVSLVETGIDESLRLAVTDDDARRNIEL